MIIETIENQTKELLQSGIPPIVAETIVFTPEFGKRRHESRVNTIQEAFNNDGKTFFWDKDERLGLVVAELIGQHLIDGCRKTTRYKIFQNLGSGRRNARDGEVYQNAFEDVFKHLCYIEGIGFNPEFRIVKECGLITFLLNDYEIWMPDELRKGILNWYARAYMCMSVDTEPGSLPFWIRTNKLGISDTGIPQEEDF